MILVMVTWNSYGPYWHSRDNIPKWFAKSGREVGQKYSQEDKITNICAHGDEKRSTSAFLLCKTEKQKGEIVVKNFLPGLVKYVARISCSPLPVPPLYKIDDTSWQKKWRRHTRVVRHQKKGVGISAHFRNISSARLNNPRDWEAEEAATLKSNLAGLFLGMRSEGAKNNEG